MLLYKKLLLMTFGTTLVESVQRVYSWYTLTARFKQVLLAFSELRQRTNAVVNLLLRSYFSERELSVLFNDAFNL